MHYFSEDTSKSSSVAVHRHSSRDVRPSFRVLGSNGALAHAKA
jgi:hypothetical protein